MMSARITILHLPTLSSSACRLGLSASLPHGHKIAAMVSGITATCTDRKITSSLDFPFPRDRPGTLPFPLTGQKHITCLSLNQSLVKGRSHHDPTQTNQISSPEAHGHSVPERVIEVVCADGARLFGSCVWFLCNRNKLP